MLTGYDEVAAAGAPAAPSSRPNRTSDAGRKGLALGARRGGRFARPASVEWLGQTTASVCWMASGLTYGVTSVGDWLQICAASAWLLANITAIATAEADRDSRSDPRSCYDGITRTR